MTPLPRAVVVGAGITGLVAAYRLRLLGWDVTVLEGSSRPGGSIHTDTFEGMPIDVGAEAFHLAVPGVAAFLDEVGLSSSVVTARTGTTWIAGPRGLRPLPAGVGPAGPTRLRPVLASGILSWPGLARAGLEPVAAVLRPRVTDPDRMSVGGFVADRFGREVAQRLVDPLLGSLHSADVDDLSLAACAPALVSAATTGRSLLPRRDGRRGAAPVGGATTGRPVRVPMSFVSWAGGMRTVVTRLVRLVTDEHGAGRGRVVTDAPVTRIEPVAGGYRLSATGREDDTVDAVVAAVPAAVAARLLRPWCPQAAAPLDETGTADVAGVVASYDRAVVAGVPALRGNGLLVPTAHTRVLKAATFLSRKWPHLDGSDRFFIRMSAGRGGDSVVASRTDDVLVDDLMRDLRKHAGVDAAPHAVRVTRWMATAPQLTVGHAGRLAAARASLTAWPGVALAGASYEGIGLGSCVMSGERAAETVDASRGSACSRG